MTSVIDTRCNSGHIHRRAAIVLSTVAGGSGEIVERLSARVGALNGTGRRAAVLSRRGSAVPAASG
ncbi:hypothetical protein EF294_01300 [Gordonia oryzae]|uniref:Uncharacterized protein n=1 Tax=Gordonia oryzae TaxID=2487349 RepID=A0A3N4GT85_9ACTN|nr:hypothetical protein EF294_01300 [Gordonia oryzae]